MPGRAVALAVLSLLIAAPAAAGGYAPLNQPGPALSVPQSDLAAALSCSGPLSGSAHAPVLLSPGTGVTPVQDFGFNYEHSLSAQGIPWCAVTMPYDTLGDIQTAAEYLVYAIRTMHSAAGRRIAILGHSQGGMSMRWALRFWPDTRPLVDDVIGLAPSNHGTTLVDMAGICASRCTPAVWQQRSKAQFVQALNSGTETFAGISYTNVYTHTDEVVTPNGDSTGSSSLHVGAGQIANIATQDICPLDVYEHLAVGTIDPVAYALALDALSHPGPANPARIDRAVCTQPYQPGVNPADVAANAQFLLSGPGLLAAASPANLVGAPEPDAEPPLRCYVTASCAGTAGGGTGGSTGSARPPLLRTGVRCSSVRRFVIHLPRNLHRAAVRIGVRRLAIRSKHGALSAVVDLRTLPRQAVVVHISGRLHGRSIRRVRRYHPCVQHH